MTGGQGYRVWDINGADYSLNAYDKERRHVGFYFKVDEPGKKPWDFRSTYHTVGLID